MIHCQGRACQVDVPALSSRAYFHHGKRHFDTCHGKTIKGPRTRSYLSLFLEYYYIYIVTFRYRMYPYLYTDSDTTSFLCRSFLCRALFCAALVSVLLSLLCCSIFCAVHVAFPAQTSGPLSFCIPTRESDIAYYAVVCLARQFLSVRSMSE